MEQVLKMEKNILKFTFLSIMLVFLMGLVLVLRNEAITSERQLVAAFDGYLKKFNKSYAGAEYAKRLKYFRQSLMDIAKDNHETGAFHGLTAFSDLSDEEFRQRLQVESSITLKQNLYNNCTETDTNSTRVPLEKLCDVKLPDYKDWREFGVVGPVLNQGQCNGCWAYSIVGIMETMSAIQLSGWTRWSIQELLDCIPSPVSEGCIKGNVDKTLDYMCINHIGLATEAEYPLGQTIKNCDIKKISGLRLKEFWKYTDLNENDLRCFVAQHGPVAVIVNAKPWKNYIGGIIQRACMRSKDGKSMDHAVQIVGYDMRGSVPYYIVRNSYGQDFGDNGYVKLAMFNNICGVADIVSVLSVTS